jgi:hypothetical protein
MDLPLKMMHHWAKVVSSETGAVFPTTYQMWRYMHRSGKVRAVKSGGTVWVPDDEIARLKTEEMAYGKYRTKGKITI